MIYWLIRHLRYSSNGEISRRVLIKTVDVLVRAKMLPQYEPKFSFYRYILLRVATYVADARRFYDSRATVAPVDSQEIGTMKLYYDTRSVFTLRFASYFSFGFTGLETN